MQLLVAASYCKTISAFLLLVRWSTSTPDFICKRFQHTPDSSHLSKLKTFSTFLMGPAFAWLPYHPTALRNHPSLAHSLHLNISNNLYFWTRGPHWITTSVKINPPKLDLSLTFLRYRERPVPVSCLTYVPVECPRPEVCYRAQCKAQRN